MDKMMNNKRRIAAFLEDEAGAITVDWVVLTAGVVGLCSAIFLGLGNGTVDYSEDIGSHMSAQSIRSY